MEEDWRKLQVGDRVRFVRLPTEFSQPGYFVHKDTLRLYKRLIARRRSTQVAYLDDWQRPVICYRFIGKSGRMEYHSLIIDDDSWVRVKPRKKTT